MVSPQQRAINMLGNTSAARLLIANNGDPGVLRPWKSKNGKSYVTKFVGLDDNGEPEYKDFLVNAEALLSREDWLKIDQGVQFQAKKRLKFWRDIEAANPVRIEDAVGTMSVQHWIGDTQADAKISMDPVSKSERSRSAMEPVQIPVPFIHSDGEWTWRDLAVNRGGRLPLDTTGINAAAQTVAETLEKLSLGLVDSFSFAGGTIYGALNFPQRLTMTVTSPETGGWAGLTLVNQVLDAISRLENNRYYGPYRLYYANPWGLYMDGDYNVNYGGETLRTRLQKIEKLESIQTLDYLEGFTILLVQMTNDVVEGMSGMDLQTVQWEEEGGFVQKFKVLCIKFPRFRYDWNRKTGVLEMVQSAAPTTTTTTTTTSTTTTTTTTT